MRPRLALWVRVVLWSGSTAGALGLLVLLHPGRPDGLARIAVLTMISGGLCEVALLETRHPGRLRLALVGVVAPTAVTVAAGLMAGMALAAAPLHDSAAALVAAGGCLLTLASGLCLLTLLLPSVRRYWIDGSVTGVLLLGLRCRIDGCRLALVDPRQRLDHLMDHLDGLAETDPHRETVARIRAAAGRAVPPRGGTRLISCPLPGCAQPLLGWSPAAVVAHLEADIAAMSRAHSGFQKVARRS